MNKLTMFLSNHHIVKRCDNYVAKNLMFGKMLFDLVWYFGTIDKAHPIFILDNVYARSIIFFGKFGIDVWKH